MSPIKLNGSTSGFVALDAPAAAGSNTLVLPTGNGSSGQYLRTNGSGTLSWSTSGLPAQALTSGTAVASTSGTAIDFTGIPSTVKRITVMFNEVSTNGTAYFRVQVGAGSVQTSSYASRHTIGTAGWNSTLTTTAGFDFYTTTTSTTDGHLVFTNISTNSWVACGLLTSSFPGIVWVGGNVTLSGTLDRIRITTVNGTDTFDAGTINIMYEG